MATLFTVNFALHPFDDTGLLFLRDIQRDIDLSWCSLFFAFQAALSQSALQTILLIGLKLHEQVMADAGASGL